MLLLDELLPNLLSPRKTARFLPFRKFALTKRCARGVTLALLVLASCPLAQAWGGKVKLARTYRTGQKIAYSAQIRTHVHLDSNPPELKTFFPPMPTDLSMHQQSTLTVAAVHPDGAADIQLRFDRFEIQTDLAGLPEAMTEPLKQAQQELTQRVAGQTLTAHYDREGQLIGFETPDKFLEALDAPVREPLRQMLRLFLEQMSGQPLYPDHRIKRGEEWTQDLKAQPLKDYAFQTQGKSTLHYSGKTTYHGVKAGIVDYHFENTLTPAAEGASPAGPFPQLEAVGIQVEVQITGKGQGRVLVALDDGRVLQNHSTVHQTLGALMKKKEGFLLPAGEVPKLEIQSDTEMEVEGNQP